MAYLLVTLYFFDNSETTRKYMHRRDYKGNLEKTDGKLYKIRDTDNNLVWGASLSFNDIDHLIFWNLKYK